ncbi:unnamed protein product [Citrullus colocynthis]|uniref:Uncharacterized protein n=1 Tax=Citrullus colocynthis TaxID=252529 RepID=A0ABP0YB81_9ROSI
MGLKTTNLESISRFQSVSNHVQPSSIVLPLSVSQIWLFYHGEIQAVAVKMRETRSLDKAKEGFVDNVVAVAIVFDDDVACPIAMGEDVTIPIPIKGKIETLDQAIGIFGMNVTMR